MTLKQNKQSLTISLILCVSALCGLGNAQLIMHSSLIPQPPPSRDLLRHLSSGTEKFALELFKLTALASAAEQRDCIISPFSIWSLLVLLAEGSKGKTYQEIYDVLGLTSNINSVRASYSAIRRFLNVNTTAIELSTSQALFTDINRPINKDYEDIIENDYKADLVAINMANLQDAYMQINNYVKNATNGRIKKIVQLEDLRDAQMMLISAISFRGSWKFPFNKSQTESEPFYDEFGTNVGNVNMMYQTGIFPYAHIPELGAHAIELPYGTSGILSMILVLPKKDQSLISVIQNLQTLGLGKLTDTMKQSMDAFADEEVELYLPRFTITSDFTLNALLEQMGILDAFDSRHADFTTMSRHPLFLSRVVHKAKIEVNEEGTIAAAATGGSFSNKNTPPRFYANRPFIYLITEKTTNTLIFCGQVRNPKTFNF